VDWLSVADRRPLVADGKSGALLERVVVDGRPYVLKHVSPEADWIMRVAGDDGRWFLSLWSSGMLDELPPVIDHATVDVVPTPDGAVIVMEDVGPWLIPDGDQPVAADVHQRFLDHLAALHAAHWGWDDDVGLLRLDRRYLWFAPDAMRVEAEAAVVPGLAVQGWERLPSLAPAMAEALFELHDRPQPFLDALAGGPRTFVHGDVKFANQGERADGTTILLDWAMPGSAPPSYDLAHHLALNNVRIPASGAEGKEATIAAYRAALERQGIDTAGWFDDHVALGLLGHMLLLGWEKALGGPGPELDWWAAAVQRGAALLG
jgi:hypothetical protein